MTFLSSLTPHRFTPTVALLGALAFPDQAKADPETPLSFDNNRCHLTVGGDADLVYRPGVERRLSLAPGSETTTSVPAFAGGGFPHNGFDGQAPLNVETAFDCRSRDGDWQFYLNGGIGNRWVQTMQASLRPSDSSPVQWQYLLGFSDLYALWRPHISDTVRLNLRTGRRGDYGYQVVTPRLNVNPFYGFWFMSSPFTRTPLLEAGLEITRQVDGSEMTALSFGGGVTPGLDALPGVDGNWLRFGVAYVVWNPIPEMTVNGNPRLSITWDGQGGVDSDGTQDRPRVHTAAGINYLSRDERFGIGAYGLFGTQEFDRGWRNWGSLNVFSYFQPEGTPLKLWGDVSVGSDGGARTSTVIRTPRGLRPNDNVTFWSATGGVNIVHPNAEVRLGVQLNHCLSRTCNFPSGSLMLAGVAEILVHTDTWF